MQEAYPVPEPFVRGIAFGQLKPYVPSSPQAPFATRFELRNATALVAATTAPTSTKGAAAYAGQIVYVIGVGAEGQGAAYLPTCTLHTSALIGLEWMELC